MNDYESIDPSAQPIALDLTGDGVEDTLILDSNADGLIDAIGSDTSGDGFVDVVIADMDGDGILESVLTDADLVAPDPTVATVPAPDPIAATAPALDPVAQPAPSDFSYTALPGIDAGVGQALDDSSALIRDTWQWAEGTFGEEEWRQTYQEAAAGDPYGIKEAKGLKDPAELHWEIESENIRREAERS